MTAQGDVQCTSGNPHRLRLARVFYARPAVFVRYNAPARIPLYAHHLGLNIPAGGIQNKRRAAALFRAAGADEFS